MSQIYTKGSCPSYRCSALSLIRRFIQVSMRTFNLSIFVALAQLAALMMAVPIVDSDVVARTEVKMDAPAPKIADT